MKKYIKTDTELEPEINIPWAEMQFWCDLKDFTLELVNQYVDRSRLSMRDDNVWFKATMEYKDKVWKMIEPHLEENDDLVTYTTKGSRIKSNKHDS